MADWRRPRRSYANGNCVEAAAVRAVVAVRDSRQAGQPARVTLAFPAAAWRAFTARVPHCPRCGSPLYDGSNCPDCGHAPRTRPSQPEEPCPSST
jgi:hypothetical protein